MEVHSFRTVVQQVTHVEAAVGRQRAYVERAKLIFRRVADTGGAVCELLDVFGIHTQMWAEIVFWCVVMLFGLAVFLAPRFDALIAEMKGKPFRPLSSFNKIAFSIVAFILASNTFQACGPPVCRPTGVRRSGPLLLQSEVRYLV